MKKAICRILMHTFFIALSISFIVPILLIISISISSETSIVTYGYSLFPKELDFSAYGFILQNPQTVLNSYKVTIIATFTGTLIGVFMMLMCAYALARNGFKYKRVINFYLFFTMLFHGGMVPSYILITQYLQLQNTIWVLILNGLVNVWYLFVLRTFIKDLPEAIIESALLDGAREFRLFLSIVIPLSKPAIATVGLFVLMGRWNEWMSALLYITDADLYPLQYLLQRILQSLEEALKTAGQTTVTVTTEQEYSGEAVRMALAVVVAGPMLFIMPFFQKYFVRGMTIGSVKG